MSAQSTIAVEPVEFRRFMSSSRPIDLDGIDWNDIPNHPIADDVLRILIYMQDVESHTVVFPRTIFSKRALEDEHVGPFLICWLYEEGMHGRALSKFLEYAGHAVPPRQRSRTTLRDRIDRTVTRMMSASWKDFIALHMAWGAVHECTPSRPTGACWSRATIPSSTRSFAASCATKRGISLSTCGKRANAWPARALLASSARS